MVLQLVEGTKKNRFTKSLTVQDLPSPSRKESLEHLKHLTGVAWWVGFFFLFFACLFLFGVGFFFFFFPSGIK